MNVTTAIQLIDELVFWPGWTFTATDHTLRFESTLLLRIDYPALNTDRPEAKAGYPTAITTYAVFPIVIGPTCTPETLYRKVLNLVGKIRVHEDREALRVAPTCWAPFHPHNIDGMQRWLATESVRDDSMFADLLFGVG